MDAETESTLRQMARDTYNKTRTAHPHMPTPDSAEGQRKIDRLFDIVCEPIRPRLIQIQPKKEGT